MTERQESRSTYYVSVQGHSILEDKGAASFEFEIQATDREVDKLRELFEMEEDAADDTFRRTFIPGIPYHVDDQNDAYDASLQDVYRRIHELGTEETRHQIEQMNVL